MGCKAFILFILCHSSLDPKPLQKKMKTPTAPLASSLGKGKKTFTGSEFPPDTVQYALQPCHQANSSVRPSGRTTHPEQERGMGAGVGRLLAEAD